MVRQIVTDDQEMQEREFIASESLRLFRELYILAIGDAINNSRFTKRVLKDAEKLQKILNNRANTRRCYYCHRTADKVELGEESETNLIQCIDCHIVTHERQYDMVRRERERQLYNG